MEKVIDAKGKKLGRVASEAAKMLLGKDEVNFANNKVADVKVVIDNASQTDITEKKRKEKTYQTYSGYPGGQKEFNMNKVITEKGYEELYRMTIKNMLPANRLRSDRMKNLVVND